MPTVHDDAICIRQWDWSETSQTVSLFCRELGLTRGLAKGARRPKSPYSGGIDILTRGRAGVIVKQTSEMALITEWDLLEQFPPLRKSLPAHYAGMYMAELIHHAVHDHDPHVALYDALLAGLRSLADEAARAAAILDFQWATLVETGYMPHVGADVRTGAELPSSPFLRFDPMLGGLIPDDAQGMTGGSWRVRSETVSVLRRLPLAAHAGAAPSPASVDRANRLLASYLRHVLGREPKMMSFLFGRQLPR